MVIRSAVAFTVLVVSLGVVVRAQVDRATLTGTVTDSTGVLIAGAKVEAVSLIPPDGQTILHWFNPAAFKVPAKGTWGNAGRYLGLGPGYWEMDLGLEKGTPVSGQK